MASRGLKPQFLAGCNVQAKARTYLRNKDDGLAARWKNDLWLQGWGLVGAGAWGSVVGLAGARSAAGSGRKAVSG
jgi:hypothetical protein